MDKYALHEETVSVNERTDKSVFVDGENFACLYWGFEVGNRTCSWPTIECLDQTSQVG